VPTDESRSIIWRPAARCVFTVAYRATDVGDGREASPARTVVAVR
jgi:hypothetical protein